MLTTTDSRNIVSPEKVLARSRFHSPPLRPPRRLPRVEYVERTGPVLSSSPVTSDPAVASLNLARGCGHRCPFCCVRASPSYPGDEVVYLYTRTAEALAKELAARRRSPRAVYVSPSTDPFPPLAEFQKETARVVEVLAAHRVEALLMTRGYIRPTILQRVAACRGWVKVIQGITTLQRSVQRLLEPLAAPPRLRIRQIARLRSLEIPVQAVIEPLVPGLTDTRKNLADLLEALAGVGISGLTAGYMFLRPGIKENLLATLETEGLADLVLSEFEGGPMLASAAIAAARYLPKPRRQRGYAALMALAAERGITVRVSAITNPDFAPPRRGAGPPSIRQRLLPVFEG